MVTYVRGIIDGKDSEVFPEHLRNVHVILQMYHYGVTMFAVASHQIVHVVYVEDNTVYYDG